MTPDISTSYVAGGVVGRACLSMRQKHVRLVDWCDGTTTKVEKFIPETCVNRWAPGVTGHDPKQSQLPQEDLSATGIDLVTERAEPVAGCM